MAPSPPIFLDKKKPAAKLDIERITELEAALDIPLVLHGGSGIENDYILKGIQAGIAKINVGTELRQPYERAMREKNDVEYARECVYKRCRELILIPAHRRRRRNSGQVSLFSRASGDSRSPFVAFFYAAYWKIHRRCGRMFLYVRRGGTFTNRLQGFLSAMEARGVSAALIHRPENMRYLTGFRARLPVRLP